jgi:hypothetical protein
VRVPSTLHELALPAEGVVHASRRRTIAMAATSLIGGEIASLTQLGRGLDLPMARPHRG